MSLFKKKNVDEGKHLTEEQKEARFWMNLKRTMATTSKQLVWIFSVNAIIWIYLSYILAFMGKDQIAESLSSSVCSVVIGEVGLYLVTSTLESIFKYNEFGFTKHRRQNTADEVPDIDPSMVGPDD